MYYYFIFKKNVVAEYNCNGCINFVLYTSNFSIKLDTQFNESLLAGHIHL